MNILDWIDVGKVSAERDDLLTSYFYDNGVLGSVLESPSSFLILGRKGAGKTALFKYLKENPHTFISDKDVLIPLSLEDYNWNIHALLAKPEAAESLAYKNSWRLVIIIEVVKSLVVWHEGRGVSAPKEIINSYKLLQKVFDTPVPSIYNIVGSKLLSLCKLKLPSAGLDLEGGLDSLEIGAGEVSFEDVKANATLKSALSQNIDHLLKVLEDSLLSCLPLPCKIYVCFDHVDEAWDIVSVEVSKKVITGLISAADSITTKYSGSVRPIVFLREDIFEVLPLNDANKLREDCGSLLKWDKDSLFRMALKRINFYANQKGIDPITDIDTLFDKKEMRQRARPSSYLLKRTMMRPRDLICLLNRTILAMKEANEDPFAESTKEYEQLEAERIYDAEPGYSEWLRKEIIDEWGVQYSLVTVLLEALQNNGSTIFTKNDLVTNMETLSNSLSEAEAIRALRFLFDNSIIGFKLGASSLWKYKCYFPSQGFIESDEYKVHDGLIRSLNLKEPREREGQDSE